MDIVRKPARDYTREEMTALLTSGACWIGDRSVQAAVHLLTFTELVGGADLANLVDIDEVTDRNHGRVLAAFVSGDNWRKLATGEQLLYRTGRDTRLLALAVSLAFGEPVELSTALAGLDSAHAGRVVEAVRIATGLEADQ